MENYTVPTIKMATKHAAIYSQVDGLSLQNLYYVYNECFPNCYLFTHERRSSDYYFDTQEFIKYFEMNVPKEDELEVVKYVTENIDSKKTSCCAILLLKKYGLFARIDDSVSDSYILYSNSDISLKTLEKFKEALMKFYVKPEDEENNLFSISSSANGLYLTKRKIKEIEDFSVERDYNDDFQHENAKIREFISAENKSGLVLLHGAKGTGKTSYIRNLISSYPNKKFVFITPEIVTMIGTPSFNSFLSTLENYIFIVEDCELVIMDRMSSGGGNQGVSTILNMTDGLMGDSISVKFICTFNTDIKNIDSALLRKGRLISKYEFTPLTIEKTHNLLKYIMENKQDEDAEHKITQDDIDAVKKGMTLADIYNFIEDSYEQKRKSIL